MAIGMITLRKFRIALAATSLCAVATVEAQTDSPATSSARMTTAGGDGRPMTASGAGPSKGGDASAAGGG